MSGAPAPTGESLDQGGDDAAEVDHCSRLSCNDRNSSPAAMHGAISMHRAMLVADKAQAAAHLDLQEPIWHSAFTFLKDDGVPI